MNPNYKLQNVEYVKPEEPKFIRDSMKHDDIEGTRPRVADKKPVRDPINVKDIEGASNRVPYQRKQTYDSVGYNDVYDKGWQTKRCTNPLQPQYQVRDKIEAGDFIKKDQTGLNQSYGQIDRNMPQALPKPVAGTRNLDTTEIKGAQAGTKTQGAFTHYQRRPDQVREVTQNRDIEGSTVGSLIKPIYKIRHTNPASPAYVDPSSNRQTASAK